MYDIYEAELHEIRPNQENWQQTLAQLKQYQLSQRHQITQN